MASKRNVFPVVYHADSDMPVDAPDFICFLARHLTDRKTKAQVFDLLPVMFKGVSRQAVEQMAVAWFDAEQSKVRVAKANKKKASAKAAEVRIAKAQKRRAA